MMDRDALHALAELLAAATGPDRKLDGAIFVATHEGYSLGQNHDGGTVILNTNGAHASLSAVLPYTDSIDAALALVERLLPGCKWIVINIATNVDTGAPETEVQLKTLWSSSYFAASAPLAILKALIAGLIQKEKTDEH